MTIIASELKPTTALLAAELGSAAVKQSEHVLNAQTVVWIFFLDSRRTVEVVVSRRGGRIVRATTADGIGQIVRVAGSAPSIARQLREFAAA